LKVDRIPSWNVTLYCPIHRDKYDLQILLFDRFGQYTLVVQQIFSKIEITKDDCEYINTVESTE
jgi:hypothetical protein